jgi:hypothetical protein
MMKCVALVALFVAAVVSNARAGGNEDQPTYVKLPGYYTPDIPYTGVSNINQWCSVHSQNSSAKRCSGILCTDEISCIVAAQTFCNTDPNCTAVRYLRSIAVGTLDMNWSIAVGTLGSFPLRAPSGNGRWEWYLKIDPGNVPPPAPKLARNESARN